MPAPVCWPASRALTWGRDTVMLPNGSRRVAVAGPVLVSSAAAVPGSWVWPGWSCCWCWAVSVMRLLLALVFLVCLGVCWGTFRSAGRPGGS